MKQQYYGLWISVMLFFIFTNSKGQQLDALPLTFLNYISTSGKCVGIDGTNNIYQLTSDNFLVKHNTDGKALFNYNSIFLNKSTIIVCENTFKTVLFYIDQGKIEVLDRRLSLDVSIGIYDLDFLDITAICTAQDNQSLWIFDRGTMLLSKIDQYGKTIQSVDIRNFQLSNKMKTYPYIKLIETNDLLFAIDEKSQVSIFDNFGNYIKQVFLDCLPNDIEAFDGKIVYKNKNNLEILDVKTNQKNIFSIPTELSEIVIGNGILVGKQGIDWKVYKY